VVAIEMVADGGAQPRTVRRPRCVWYQRIGRWWRRRDAPSRGL